MRSPVIRKDLRAELLLLHVDRGQLSWLGFLVRTEASLVKCSRHVAPGGEPEVDPGHAGVTMFLGWPGNTLGSPRGAGPGG